jgi:hypothetical protein
MQWGAYWASRNVPICGIHDPDHRVALMASLRLACNAFPSADEALGGATAALLGKPFELPAGPSGLIVISLGFNCDRACARLDGFPGPSGTPALSGDPQACALLQAWLGGLSV